MMQVYPVCLLRRAASFLHLAGSRAARGARPVLLLPLLLLLASCVPPGAAPGSVDSASVAPVPVVDAPGAAPAPEPAVLGMPASPAHGQAGAASIGDAYFPELGNAGYNATHYTLKLNIDPAKRQLVATTIVSATATLAGLGRMSLDFEGPYAIDAVRVGGAPATFYRSPAKLYVDLPQALDAGTPFAVAVDYHGAITPRTSSWLGSTPLGLWVPDNATDQVVAFNEPDGAHVWFPCNDHPRDPASFRVEATVPAGLVAVSNGELVSEQDGSGGQNTFIWQIDAPIPTYLLSLAVGDYQRVDMPAVDGVTIRHYVFKRDAAQLASALYLAPEMLRFMTSRLGSYPFREFGFVEVAQGISMETPTMIMATRGDMAQAGSSSTVLVDTTAHQWFGGRVGLQNWSDIWLSEGLAGYFQLLWETQHGSSPAAVWHDEAQAVIKASVGENGALSRPGPRYLLGEMPFHKGAWVTQMLRSELGDDVFWQVLRRYVDQYGGREVTSADLKSVAEDVSGRNLDGFFHAWVDEPGVPQVDATWAASPDGHVGVQFCAKRSPAGTPLSDGDVLPMDVLLQAGGATSLQTVRLTGPSTVVTLTVPFAPQQVALDPDGHLLAITTVRQAPELAPCP